MQELSILLGSTKKQKVLDAGTLFKKALDEIYGQTLQIYGVLFDIGNIQFFTKFEVMYSWKTHIIIQKKPELQK